MGPNHDGITRGVRWPQEWPETPWTLVWEKEIGIGFSSVAIAEQRLFTMGHEDGEETVFALDAKTGKTLWSHSYPAPLVDNLHEGGPGATPTIDGDYVYTLGRGGHLFCFAAASGDIIWEKDLQSDLGTRLPEWGFTSSPYILGDQLLLEAGRVVSYAKTSGEKNWQTDSHSAGYGSVISFKHRDNTLLASLDCDGLRVVDSQSGTEVGFHSWPSPFETNSTTPIYHDGQLYISAGYNVGCGLFKVTESGNLQRTYSNRDMRNHFNNSILLDGYLYGFDGNSNLGRVVQLTCMQWATGKVAWQHRGLGCGSLMIADDRLVILSEDGRLVIADATPDAYQQQVTTQLLTGRCWTMPVLVESCVYARNARGRLVCATLP